MALDSANSEPRFATLECTENDYQPEVFNKSMDTEEGIIQYDVRAGDETGVVVIDEDGTTVEGRFEFPSEEDDSEDEE